MQSVTQFTDFQELFDYANLADKDFSAEKQNAIVITADQQKQVNCDVFALRDSLAKGNVDERIPYRNYDETLE